MVYMGGKAKNNASRSNQITHFGVMGGLAPSTNVAQGVKRFRLRRARNKQTIPLMPIPGLQYMKEKDILSKNPAGSGGVGLSKVLVDRAMGPCNCGGGGGGGGGGDDPSARVAACDCDAADASLKIKYSAVQFDYFYPPLTGRYEYLSGSPDNLPINYREATTRHILSYSKDTSAAGHYVWQLEGEEDIKSNPFEPGGGVTWPPDVGDTDIKGCGSWWCDHTTFEYKKYDMLRFTVEPDTWHVGGLYKYSGESGGPNPGRWCEYKQTNKPKNIISLLKEESGDASYMWWRGQAAQYVTKGFQSDPLVPDSEVTWSDPTYPSELSLTWCECSAVPVPLHKGWARDWSHQDPCTCKPVTWEDFDTEAECVKHWCA